MARRQSQNRTFNRTGRQAISTESVAIDTDPAKSELTVGAISRDGWYDRLPESLTSIALVHVDVSSRFANLRQTFSPVREVVDGGWRGARFRLPSTLLDGGNSVGATVTVTLPPEHAQGGLVLARSKRISVSAGVGLPQGGKSALRIQPHPDVHDELWRLSLTDKDGPIVYHNPEIPGWAELRESPLFKYGILPELLRSIYFDIALHQNEPRSWASTWLSFPGAKGYADELPAADGDLSTEEISELRGWASDVTESVCTAARLFSKFEKAAEVQR